MASVTAAPRAEGVVARSEEQCGGARHGIGNIEGTQHAARRFDQRDQFDGPVAAAVGVQGDQARIDLAQHFGGRLPWAP